jgi:threonine dehydrogenase-like Zn-dependent dehydrogenase
MPKQLMCTRADTVYWVEYEVPDGLGEKQLRVRADHGAEKHGTMKSFVHGHGNRRGAYDKKKGMHVPDGVAWDYPIALGNMQVGVVEQVGAEVKGFTEGDRVVHYGGFRERADVNPARCWRISDGLSWKSAVCIDSATYALTAVRDGNVRTGDSVAVFSLGAIGLMAVAIVKAAGCGPVIAVDPIESRRNAAARLGADETIDPLGLDAGAVIRELTGYRGVDVVIEYAGVVSSLQAALKAVAYGGTVAFGAFPGPMAEGLDLGAEAHMNRPNLVFTRTESEPSREYPRWDIARVRATVLRLFEEGRISGEDVVTPVVPFDDSLPEQYERYVGSPNESIKMGVSYDRKEDV